MNKCRICKRGFEFGTGKKTFQVILEIKEVKE